ncbi:MAG: 2-dehydropantoate 2-reductase [bacterium]|nr:2-dehydropantoate 2-reductase [bacterium]
MKILVMGSGGLGGYFGARLAASGCDVTFVARGRHLEAMRAGGLRIESALAPLYLRPVQVTDRPETAGISDVVLLAVKLWDTEEAARAALPAIGPQTTVISFQNGVDAAERLAAIVGAEHVVGGVCYIAAAIESPGVIRHTGSMQRLVIGEVDGGISPRVEAFAAACKTAGIDIQASAGVQRAIWEKFVFLVGLSASTCVMRNEIGAIRANPRSRALMLEIMREAVAVGRARGVDLDPAFAEDRLAFADTLPAQMVASMYVDLQRGNRLELPWLSGAVARLGGELHVPTPANRFVTDALALYVEGGAAS